MQNTNQELEIWKDVPNYEGIYQASTKNNIRSLDRYVKHPRGCYMLRKGRFIKPQKHTNGYLFVNLSKDGKIKYFSVHRLIAITFFGESKLTVDHIDESKENNMISNLEYVTLRENLRRKRINKKGFTGYFRKDKNHYSVHIKINGKRYNLGVFKDKKDCNDAYNRAFNDIENIEKYIYRKKDWFLPKGVTKNGNNFTARKTINKKCINIGTFKTIEEAKNAYDEFLNQIKKRPKIKNSERKNRTPEPN